MNDPGTLADEDLSISGWPEDTPDGAHWDSYPIEDWGTYVAEQTQPAAAPWFRNPRLLFGLIAVAAAALVVATVLLITDRESGEIPTTPQLSTRTAPNPPSGDSTPRAPSEIPSTPASPSPGAESSSAESSSAESSSAGSEESPAQAELPAAPAPSPTASQSPAGPKINVTRTPMSFTPGKH